MTLSRYRPNPALGLKLIGTSCVALQSPEMSVTFKEVSKKYGAITVLHPTELEVADREFLTILGPSGSGKTTILRLVGGSSALAEAG